MKEKLKKINEYEWLLPKSVREGMNVDAKIIANKLILDSIEEEAVKQLTNVAMLPGVVEPVIGLPDMHWGYGLPMGAVSAFDEEEGIISSGLCGFDINCGINLIRTNLTANQVKEKAKELANALFDAVPCGVGSKGKLKLTNSELNEVLINGVKWALKNGYITKEDLENTEEKGCMEGADPNKVSDLAKRRGLQQLGTLGAGNHFLEVQKVTNIFDKKTADKWGIKNKDQVTILLHCLPADAKILTQFGSWVKIKDLEKSRLKIKCFDVNTHKILDTEIEKFYKVSKKEKMFRLKTKTGKEILTTEDHPLLTKDGLKFIGEINKGDAVAIFPFEGVEHEDPDDEIIIKEEDIRKIYNSDKIISELKKKGFLPLRMNSWQLPILIKFLGYVTGDGHIYKPSPRSWRIIFTGDENDLNEINSDIKNIGFKQNKIKIVKSGGRCLDYYGKEIKIYGEVGRLECNATSLSLLLVALGAPHSTRKTIEEFVVPRWINDAPKWMKRLYLAAYFGAELTHPTILKTDFNIERPSLAVYKLETLKENGIKFLSQISQQLKEFGVEAEIIEENGGGRITKVGKTVKLVLRISSELLNLINFFSKIGYEYCKRKNIESSQALQFLEYKYNLILKESIIFNKDFKKISHIELKRRHFNYPKFSEFISLNKLNPITSVIWSGIESVEEVENKENFVYDIKVKNGNHNFIANNFIVGNCGSRGLGHQTATDYLKIQEKAVKRYNIKLPDPQLVCAPIDSKEGQDFFSAMKCAVNYSFTNRAVMTKWIRETFEKIFGKTWQDMEMETVYAIAHNVIKYEKHNVNGEERNLYVHRKGATKSFPNIPVLIAGTMGTSSYLLKGTKIAMQKSFGSSAHGAGRAMSRHAAIKKFWGSTVQKELEEKGIVARATHPKSLAEENVPAYKDVDLVVDSVHGVGISLRVAKMVPLLVCKG